MDENWCPTRPQATVRSAPGLVASPRMTSTAPHPTQADRVEAAATLLDVVARHDVGPALDDLEDIVAKVRSSAQTVAEARRALRATPPEVLREAIQLRANRTKALR